MQRVGKFEKVSFDQFYSDMRSEFCDTYTVEEVKSMYDSLQLPKRSNIGDSGYDFFAPFDIKLSKDQVIKIPTGIRVIIEDGWFLGCFPRSGLGFKYFSSLANTIGIVDSRYYQSSNEGHIMCKMINRNPKEVSLEVKRGQGFMQGIFMPYGITQDDETNGVRDGGFGSTDKK